MVAKVVSIILCILLPPVAVYLEKGCVSETFVNILLTLLCFWLGGIIHAFFAMQALKKWLTALFSNLDWEIDLTIENM